MCTRAGAHARAGVRARADRRTCSFAMEYSLPDGFASVAPPHDRKAVGARRRQRAGTGAALSMGLQICLGTDSQERTSQGSIFGDANTRAGLQRPK